MEIFLPSEQAASVKIGAEGRITLDYAPDRAVPGYVSFVSPEAQFTPKQVETRSEREKLMFRVKIQVPKELASQYVERIKTGVRGVGYVKIDPSASLAGLAAEPRRSPARELEAQLSDLGDSSMVSSASSAGQGGKPVVSIKDVTHRYGKVVALDGISLDIPSGIMVGIVGPDGVGKSTLMALIAGSKKMQQGTVTVLDGDIARRPASARRGPADRVHASGPGQESLSGAQRPRQRRLHGATVRAVGRGA